MKIERPSRNALVTYFRGLSSQDESKLIIHYLSLDIDAGYIESCMREAWSELDREAYPLSQTQKAKAWEIFQSKQNELNLIPSEKKQKWFIYAACISFFILSTLGIIAYQRYINKEATPTVYRAALGKQLKVLLKDSSNILLFPGSSLTVPANFNQADRKVELSGRAYFKVTHNNLKVFEVHSDLLTTKVLGTSFEVNADRSDSQQIITLHTGRINVSYDNRTLANLQPNQQLIYNQKNRLFKVIKSNATETISWINGELTYDLIPLKQICLDLEKWYAVKIEIRDQQLANKKISTSFKDIPLNKVLDMISITTGISYTIKGDHITIY